LQRIGFCFGGYQWHKNRIIEVAGIAIFEKEILFVPNKLTIELAASNNTETIIIKLKRA